MYPADLANAAQCQLVQAVIDYKRCKCFYGDCPFPTDALKTYMGLDCPANYALTCPTKPSKSCHEIVDADGYLNINATAQLCSYSLRLGNHVDGTPRAAINLINNSFDHHASLGLYASSFECGELDDALISSHFSVYTTGIFQGLLSYTNGYLTKLKLYTSATTSVLFDVSPINLPFWTSCTHCASINPSNLVFSSPSFPSALKTLIENIAATLFDAPAHQNVRVFVEQLGPPYYIPNTLQIRTAIKHQGSQFLTINPQDLALYFSPGIIGGPTELLFMGHTSYVTMGNLPVFNNTHTVPLGACSLTLNVSPTSPFNYTFINTSASTVNNIVLNNGGIAPQATLISPTNFNCTEYILSASHSLPGNIVSKGWYFPINTLISTNDTIVVSTPGTYYFKIQTDVLPLITKSVTVP